ncbi:MAG TPA: FAD:protein FMN transferase [Jatrophihabitans sp.]|nr:FAD:protein FMN transferase [Jatrophihabitans sp.]
MNATLCRHRFDAMASTVDVQLCTDDPAAQRIFDRVEAAFAAVERGCSRFLADSSLMRANRAGADWCAVSEPCLQALQAAYLAYACTDGRFDPRVLGDLERLGYAGTFSTVLDSDETVLDSDETVVPDRVGPVWQPEFRTAPPSVRIGLHPVDLGGIAKGVALRRARDLIRSEVSDFCLTAGGDCYLGGGPVDGSPWLVGVEDPAGGSAPRAVLALSDTACATSSVRVRQWRRGGRRLHHLIDPLTGEPADSGLLAVTVTDSDPVWAEVLTKLLFLAGAAAVEARAERLGIAALWFDEDSRFGCSSAMAPAVRWWSR